MNCHPTNPADGVSRRSVLAAAAAGLTLSTSGCIDRVESVVGQDITDRLALSITTVPADNDREAVRIARHLEDNLEAVGADVSIDMRSPSEFLRAILIDHDFDLYVGRHPGGTDPDFLYGALHSKYAAERGWQNPFGFDESPSMNPPEVPSEGASAISTVDELLEEQRRAGENRSDVVAAVLRELVERKPFDAVCIPHEYRVARTDRFGAWNDDEQESVGRFPTRHGFLDLDPESGVNRLRALITDTRPTRNLNPLSATIRDRGMILDLLYDSLLTERDGELVPWLAEDVEWDDGTLRIKLREECPFHDDEDDEEDRYVTAEDVRFTYRFLQDTSLGNADRPSPAPRYRSRVSVIDDPDEDIVVEDFLLDHPRKLRIDVATDAESVARRALTVPILPAHRWRDQVESRSESDTASQGKWGLVTMSNIPPVGSGLFRFVSNNERESLTLERNDEHFTRDDDSLPDVGDLESIQFGIDPGGTAVDRVANDGADITASMLSAHTLKNRLEEEEESDVTWVGPQQSKTFYHIGYNTRSGAFSSPHARRLVSRLLDKAWIVDDVFGDHADPVTVPLADEWVPDELAWNEDDDEDPVTPFFGSNGDLDVDAAREAFADEFRYDNQGRLRL